MIQGHHATKTSILSARGMALIFKRGIPDVEVRLSTVWPPFSHELESDDFIEPLCAGYRRAHIRRADWAFTPTRSAGAFQIEGSVAEFRVEGPMDDPRAEVVGQVFVDAESNQLLWADRLPAPIRWTTPGTIEVLPILSWPDTERAQ